MTGYRTDEFPHNTITILYDKKVILRTHEWAHFERDYITKSGNVAHFDPREFLTAFKSYMETKNEISAKDKTNEYWRIFALLDKRTGERTLRKYRDEGDFLECATSGNQELENIYRIRFSISDVGIDEDMINLIKEIKE